MLKKTVRSKKLRILLALVFLMVCIMPVVMPLEVVNAAVQATYYLSPAGNDTTGNGSMGSPWQTIQKARDVVRTINSNMTGDIIVYLRGGTYQLASTILFGSSDSGTNGYTVFYKAYAGETPVISGGKTITGWTVHSGSIYKTNAGTSDQFRQIYVNGVRGVRARSAGALPGAVKTAAGYTTTDGNMQNWGNKNQIEFLYVSPNRPWSLNRLLVSNISGTTVTMQDPGWAMLNGLMGAAEAADMKYMENAYELLDQPGEWYLNRTTHVLFYMPRAGEDMSTANVEVPVVEKLVEIMGTLDVPVSNIQFEGIKIKNSNYIHPNTAGEVSCQANQYYDTTNDRTVGNFLSPIAAVTLENAKSIKFERCDFLHLGSVAINIYMGSQNNVVNGCKFIDIAGSGIQLGKVSFLYSDNWNPADTRKIIKNNRITNSYFDRCSVDYKGGVAIFGGWTEGTSILHNEINYQPYSGISLGWGWEIPTYQPNVVKNTYIKYNYIHDVMLTLADGAGVYTVGPNSAGSGECSYNFIKNSIGEGIWAIGVYHDQASTNWMTNYNVFNNIKTHWLDINWDGHNCTANMNYIQADTLRNMGDATCVVTNTNIYSGDNYPSGAQTIINGAGIEAAYRDIIPQNVRNIWRNICLDAGVTATASSWMTGQGEYPANGAINGDRNGVNWGNGGGWGDNTLNSYPDWLQVDFGGSRTLREIDVFTLQDGGATNDPTLSMTFTQSGNTAFDVQYWNGSAWVTVPYGSVTGNNKVWRKITFSPITTNRIRVVVNGNMDRYSRIVELEAYEAHNLCLDNGVTATASTYMTGQGEYSPYGAINGDRKGLNWGNDGGWGDNTLNSYPDWLQVDFGESKTIGEIDVFTIQDAYAINDPTESMTFTQYGNTAFDVQYWNGSGWVTVPNGSITGNNMVWKKIAFSHITTSKIRVVVNGNIDRYSRIVELEAFEAQNICVDSGVTVTASSVMSGYEPSGAVNGDCKGVGWGAGGGWGDNTLNTYPDWLQVDFGANKTINEIDVFTLQDGGATNEPTLSMTFTQYGNTAFDVQYWNESTWVTVPNGSVTGNNNVWRQFTFSPVTTSKIRVVINNNADRYSRIIELEAWE